ncbi:hypothetical protein EVAR_58019_1 [Eumeta japonica]|uniref:Uncharacterized protein n=1 Tax=Eumeta variegata TaxID=151549 RepID=A0A4C1YA52_EUMVA|nr:hypothetical protein EVAR_58019_1 [Eumeta japonica]
MVQYQKLSRSFYSCKQQRASVGKALLQHDNESAHSFFLYGRNRISGGEGVGYRNFEKGVDRLMEEGMSHRNSHLYERRNVITEAATSRPYTVGVWRLKDRAGPLPCSIVAVLYLPLYRIAQNKALYSQHNGCTHMSRSGVT